jgi:hypothetical protein
MARPEPEPRGPFDSATDANTKPTFLTDPKSGESVLGEGVEANVQDLTAYSGNLDQIQMNFTHLGTSMAMSLQEMAREAFAGNNNIFEWSRFFYQLSSHTIVRFGDFVRDISQGMLNVAMAAQTVANVYTETDATSAANLQAINFAFGDKDSAPAGIPKQFLKELKTWEVARQENANAGAAAALAAVDDPRNHTSSVTVGDTTTTTVTIPGMGTVVTVTKVWTTYPGGPSGQTVTVTYNGNVQRTTQTTTVGSTTTSTTTQSFYDEDGKRRDQVTGRTTETVSAQGTNIQTDSETTSYGYDPKGEKKVDESTTRSTVSVGLERPQVPMSQVTDDPTMKKPDELTSPG